MLNKTMFALIIVTTLVAIAFFSPNIPQAQATSTVKVSFATNGLNAYNGLVLTIDGVGYDYWTLTWQSFQWTPGSTHTVVASTPLTGWDTKVYRFSSWTNGNGLTGASGTFTVPASGTTVTANYAISSVRVNFATSGLSNFNGVVLTIDGTAYDYWNMPSFQWVAGSTHTVVALTPLTGWDSNVYRFQGWTNGNGLIGSSGTFTVPASDTTVTANYAISSVSVKFATGGLSNFNGVVLTIDGAAYDYWNMPSFQWVAGSSHTVVASTPLTGWDNNIYRFSSWTNGNGLTGASGTFIVPTSNTTVTANYAKTTVKVSFATSGLGSLNGIVLAIDGVGYDYWNVPWTSFIWESGSTHTVVASTPLTSLDNKIYQFSSWTNGNGLTGASGTFTVPTSNTTVTANYALSTTPLATSLTINCSPLTVDKTGSQTTTISGYLTSGGLGVSGKTIAISYNSGASSPIGVCVSGANGYYQFLWDVPVSVANGYYVIKAEFAGDASYLGSSAQTSGGGNLFVVPEFPFGALAALAACLGAFAVFKKRRSFS